MSSKPGPQLLGLAPEIVENVIKQVSERRDLSNTRLSCKTLEKHAAKELFQDIFISPLEEHVSTWNSISQDDVIRRLPRHAIIQTHSDIEDHGLGCYREEEEVGEEFKGAVAALSRFPNLDSVEIGFTPECVGVDKRFWQDVAEEVSDRQERLKFIFQAIKDRAAEDKNRTIRKLTIINLQNCPLPDFTSSDLFRDVMGQLDELHISLTQEYNEHGPDHDYTKIELQTFPAYFCSDWLKPISANLKALSIYSKSDNWGPFPGYFDPRGISFPKLETLALGYYTLAHDHDLDWILAIKSLRKLILHNCMILSWIRIESSNMREWKVRKHDWVELPDEGGSDWCNTFAYGGKWSQYLDRIVGALPNLVDFRFDQAQTYADQDESQYGLNHRDSCGNRIFPQRYICFDNGILPTHWPEADDDGDMHSWLDDGFPTNKHKENLEADQKSLDRLLEKLRKSRS
ncbi:hypothetical protein SLS60_000541 [Paraconiothyrium brasiliense]|uniref:F-box domain-containing protein n=1 Tax=Paraconiothyrium brasiliense TaxID=300254 RepID=A0ABR3S6M7_9PLEO